MAELKNAATDADVNDYLSSIENEQQRLDCQKLTEIISKLTGKPPRMWGKSMVGFGSYHYKYASGREGDWFLTGFSARKNTLSLYIMAGFDQYEELLKDLGEYKTGKSCLYIKSLNKINIKILQELIVSSVNHMKKNYPTN